MKELHIVLVLGLATAVACGGAAGQTPPSQPPLASPDAGAAGRPASSAGATAPSDATARATTHATETTLPAHVDLKTPVPTAMGDELQALGLDVKNLPPIEKLDPKALRGVMKVITRSLGARCGDCHAVGDFAAPTRRKKIAARMWDEWAARLTLSDNAPLFCDSCHQGRMFVLDRSDKKALAKWMAASFVSGMDRKDGKSLECETCHVDMEMHFLSKWGGDQ